VYKALYRLFGGFVADVVAAIDQVCKYILVFHLKCFITQNSIVMSKMSYALVGSSTLDEKLFKFYFFHRSLGHVLIA
jgi:hypothetical protein